MKLFKAVPWVLVLGALKVLVDHYSRLSLEDRARLGEIMRETRGMPQRFAAEHRQDIMDIASRVDKLLLGRDLIGLASPLPLPGKKKNKQV